MNQQHQKIITYFERPGSRWGYDILLRGAKHFGYYPSGKTGISEWDAQERMQDLIAEKLHLRARDRVLDAGCGQGVVATYLARKYGSRVTGITIVPFEVGRANDLARKRHVADRCTFHLMDYTRTEFPDNTFDAVYTMESLVHSPAAKETLKGFYRILKPGGRLALFEYTIAPEKVLQNQANRDEARKLTFIIEQGAMPSLKLFRHGTRTKLIEQVGFRNSTEIDISWNTWPSVNRLYRMAKIPYYFVHILGAEKFFPNMTTAAWLPTLIRKDLVRYTISLASKPG